ncbi:HTH-type transcriptional regulator Mce2R [Variibacter gotjawalensis]|uniref:HTH-type transcriptional regulator Mce2R n=1 Tax=Variibacter gotjawalensis TaxID=1333996 RepID=A0A0S3PU83_9BRAD|nr:FCD domain-containing protein [Variibacter gotjawalensis]NIK49792.1 DNA-binding FadR family transcriptional regulator [Variibacter gotjawalensis]RZS45796.1 GntR family transcriptional regulator [Variibacter gotjawalensis]BAT59469.1 HTH-type transcriptional regulator Mce2R [Variibacter gotjawalensis]
MSTPSRSRVANRKTKEAEVPTWQFHPISGVRAHLEVVQQLAFAILAGAYALGERLPNIEALSRLMGVSKPVIGAALKVLAADGTVIVQRGIKGGLTVGRNDVSDKIAAMTAPLAHMTALEVVEARRPIELQIALLAAERATASDFQILENSIVQLEQNRWSSPQVRIRYDHLFHYALGRAGRNAVLALYQYQILERLFVDMKSYFLSTEDVDFVIKLHRQTLDAIQSGRAARIENAIDEHLSPLEAAVAKRYASRRRSRKAKLTPKHKDR